MDEEKRLNLRKKVQPMRINFDDANQIMNYGTNIAKEVADVLQMISGDPQKMSIEDLAVYKKRISKIANFSKDLELETDIALRGTAKTKDNVFKLVNKVFKKDLKVGGARLYQIKEEQLKNLDEIEKFFDDMLNDIKNNVQMNQAYLHEMDPYLELLAMLIQVGYEDSNDHQKMIDAWKKEQAEPSVIMLEEMKEKVLKRRLIALEKAFLSYKQQQGQLNIGIYNKFVLAENCQEILGTTLPLIRSEIHVQFSSFLDKIMKDQQKKLSEKMTKVYIESAERTAQTTRELIKLSEEGMTSVETYEKVGRQLEETFKLIRKMINDDHNYQKEREKISKIIIPLQDGMSELKTYLANFDESNDISEKAKVLKKDYFSKVSDK